MKLCFSTQLKALTILLIVSVYVAAVTVVPLKANAISGSQFNAGRIIDDVIFTDNTTMSPSQIHNFLNAKVGTCDTWGTRASNHWNSSAGQYYTRAEWGALNGNSAPFTCINQYIENPVTKQNNYLNPNATIPGGKGAAQIIYEAALQYRINPQVILVTLQKEQGLITDNWPWYDQYKSAMGYACPDTAPCDTKYYGFYNQVDNAAWQFRYYLDHPNAYNYWVGNYYVRYNPSASCGGSVVNIQNPATAALYIYTPYQPNAGALAQVSDSSPGPGGVNCGAYGNRNFWWYFNQWFGASLGVPYDYQFAASSPWGVNLEYEEVSEVTIRLKNTGTRPWYADGHVPAGSYPLRLMTKNYQPNVFADMSDPNWLSNSQIRMTEPLVQSGEYATFKFRIKGPKQATMATYDFYPVIDGYRELGSKGIQFTFASWPPAFQLVSPSYFYFYEAPNSSFTGIVSIKNTSKRTWYSDNHSPAPLNPTRLVTYNDKPVEYADRSDPAWISGSQIKMSTPSVAPGQTATFTFKMKAPMAKRSGFSTIFVPIISGTTGMSGTPVHLYVDVPQPIMSFSSVSVPTAINMNRNVSQQVTFQVKNTGNFIWRNETTAPSFPSMRLITAYPYYRTSKIYANDGSWLSTAQIKMVENTVYPGQTATFRFNARSADTGLFQETFEINVDGVPGMARSLGSSLWANVQP